MFYEDARRDGVHSTATNTSLVDLLLRKRPGTKQSSLPGPPPLKAKEQVAHNAAAASCPVEEACFLGALRSLWDAGSESRVCVCGVVYLTHVTLHLVPR